MEKVICALWKPEAEDRDAFNSRILKDLPAQLETAGVSGVRINLEDPITDTGAALRQTRGAPQHHATIQFWMPSANAIFRSDVDAVLSAAADRFFDFKSNLFPASAFLLNCNFCISCYNFFSTFSDFYFFDKMQTILSNDSYGRY